MHPLYDHNITLSYHSYLLLYTLFYTSSRTSKGQFSVIRVIAVALTFGKKYKMTVIASAAFGGKPRTCLCTGMFCFHNHVVQGESHRWAQERAVDSGQVYRTHERRYAHHLPSVASEGLCLRHTDDSPRARLACGHSRRHSLRDAAKRPRGPLRARKKERGERWMV